MVDPRHDDDQPVRTRDVRALADLGVTHPPDDHAALLVAHRLAEDAAGPAGERRRWSAGRSARNRRRSSSRAPEDRRRWSPSRPLALALVGTIATASVATAATIALTGTPSEPLQGALPAAERSSAEVRSSRYRVALYPTLTIGESGWCLTQETMDDAGTVGSGGATCSTAATAESPLIAGMSGSLASDRPGAQIVSSVVDRRVAGLRLHDGSVVTARADPSLPDGWRSLIVIQERPRATRYLGPDGRALPNDSVVPYATDPDPQPFRDTDPDAPPRSCSIRTGDPASVRVVSARELTGAPKVTGGLNGRPFLSCATARMVHAGADYTAALLVDAGDPGRHPARLPGSTPRDGAEVTVPGEVARPATTARRVGSAWLVVQGTDPDGRRAVLDGLRVGP